MKAIALVSGGLDSTLATKLMQDLGFQIFCLNFKTPFCLCEHSSISGCFSSARRLASELGVEFKLMNISEEFFTVIKKPKHGYGSHMNPCIDCRILKFRKAKDFMQEIDASFIITGEVLGQRPMSQHRRALEIIDRESGLEGLVLRPLSARLLPETIPEKEGWVSRDKLLDFSGRTRRPQIELAKIYRIQDYPCPAGGCLLTDPEFSKKLKDLLKQDTLNLNNVELLKTGRHLRLRQDAKLVVGRDERENGRLLNLAQDQDYVFMPAAIAGPTALGRGNFDEGLIGLACSITCRYADLDGQASAEIVYKKFSAQEEKKLSVAPIREPELSNLRIK